MSKQKQSAEQLVTLLNMQYGAIDRNLHAIKEAADSENEVDMLSYMKHGKLLDAAFDKTLKALKKSNAVVKFDTENGEYFVGENKFRLEYRAVMVGYVEIEAPTEQIAFMKAQEMASTGEINTALESGTIRNVSEAV